jgi:hypothetical protein
VLLSSRSSVFNPKDAENAENYLIFLCCLCASAVKKKQLHLYLGMTLHVDIINPKAAKLLKDLADLNLIVLREVPEDTLLSKIKSIRKKAQTKSISLETITQEVEKTRSARYAKQKKTRRS